MSGQFFGGLPTAMDVRRLNEIFNNLTEGEEITHEQIEQAIGQDRKSHRYRTVTIAWRRHLLTEKNIEVGAVPGLGFRVLTPSERMSGGIKGFQSGARKQMRSIKRTILVRSDDPTIIRQQEIMQRIGAAIVHQASTMMKEVEPPKPVERNPRITHFPQQKKGAA